MNMTVHLFQYNEMTFVSGNL